MNKKLNVVLVVALLAVSSAACSSSVGEGTGGSGDVMDSGVDADGSEHFMCLPPSECPCIGEPACCCDHDAGHSGG